MMIKDFLGFLTSGVSSLEVKNKFESTIKVFFLQYLMFGIGAVFVSLITTDRNQVQLNTGITQSIWTTLFLSGIISPIIEELSFRLVLTKDFRAFVLGIFSFFASVLIYQLGITIHFPFPSLRISFILTFLLVFAILYLFGKFLRVNSFKASQKWITFLIHFTSLFFALAHFKNLNPVQESLTDLIKIVPYLLMGYVFAYARVRIGLWSAIVCHILRNTISLSFLYFS